MEGQDADQEKQRGDWGAWRGPDIDGGWGARRSLEDQGATAFTQGRSNPGDQVVGDPAFP